MTHSTWFAEDVERVTRVVGVTTLDGIGGWLVCDLWDGTRWAYAPQHVALLTGEIARQVAL